MQTPRPLGRVTLRECWGVITSRWLSGVFIPKPELSPPMPAAKVWSALCLLCGIGIGTFIATFTRSAQQAMLLSFFINPPLASLSGALAPVEAMPKWLQPITLLNPIRHFGVITRGVMIKGSALSELWPNFVTLIAFALILMGFSVWRFRRQLG